MEPLIAWTPTLAVAGIDYYGHDAIPGWQHSILMTTLKADRLVVMNLSEDGLSVLNDEHYFIDWWGRLRDVCVSPDGRIFIASSNRDGRGDVRAGDDRIVELRKLSTTGIERNPSPVLYPNPIVSGELNIRNEWKNSEVTIRIFDSMGRNLDTYLFESATPEIRLNMKYPSGIYFIKIINGNDIQRLRVLVSE